MKTKTRKILRYSIPSLLIIFIISGFLFFTRSTEQPVQQNMTPIGIEQISHMNRLIDELSERDEKMESIYNEINLKLEEILTIIEK